MEWTANGSMQNSFFTIIEDNLSPVQLQNWFKALNRKIKRIMEKLIKFHNDFENHELKIYE
jgi:hypothetical protein